jgi:hypothetical protein
MIEVRYFHNRWSPMLICDMCNFPINPNLPGVAVWEATVEPALRSPTNPKVGQRPALHAHKGRCQMKAERKFAEKGAFSEWEELGVHLLFLFENAGFKTLEEIKETAEITDRT